MLPVLSFALYQLYLFSILFVQEAEATDFNDLGKMLLGGFALALAVAVLFVFVRLRLRDKNPQKAEFLSISNGSERK
jgi:high-affinity Fe2+/Pb2+ permease